MTEQKKDDTSGKSKLSLHKRDGKKLIPPLLQIPNLSFTPWVHTRLPEMLWGALVINSLERDEALKLFRHVGEYASKNKDFSDITLSGIGKYPDQKIKEFIQHSLSWSKELKVILRPLLLYKKLPAAHVWKELLEEPNPKEDWKKVTMAIKKTYNHQSQEATDCRWLKIYCMIVSGKMVFSKDTETAAKEILEYPNYGEMKKVRPTIRAIEISLTKNDSDWPKLFWKQNFESTDCVPEEIIGKKMKSRQEEFAKQINDARPTLLEETRKVRNELITHFIESMPNTEIDSKRETAFGLALYSTTLFSEIVFYSAASSITGRMALRALTENYINFKYLTKKEKEEPKIWEDFHNYGTGQAKLIYLKLKELAKQPSCIEMDSIDMIANEDRWMEFTPINIGHWENSDLRKMSEEAGVKEIYDLYYNYTSGFTHGTRAALRESIYQICMNPLHRFHRIPQFELPLMPNITIDAITIVNKTLDCLDETCPKFKTRIKEK